ncbi:MAG: uroporphyrinogen decarboxylase family protein [Synergistaceae bacterium]|nr:uroporphyrinogen decarboxylase family protein [Synergistaceae bacterium]
MNMNNWLEEIKAAPRKKAMPVLSFPCVTLMGITVRELISDSGLQAKGMKMVADKIDSLASVSMMDLSVEAEAFGSTVHISDEDVPTVVGSVVNSIEEAEALAVPPVGTARTGRYIEALGKACELITDRPVFAGVIGPFSLAGRLVGVAEALVNCIEKPDMMKAVLRKSTDFLVEYAKAYKAVGANGIVMAEPLTGLLSPRLAVKFSESYVREIVEAVQDDNFIVIYHNCGGSAIKMTESIARTGSAAFHFGNSISLREMLELMPKDKLVMGNVSPSDYFYSGTPETMKAETKRIMGECCQYPNFVISSGCDIPAMSPWENITAFFEAADEFYNERGK